MITIFKVQFEFDREIAIHKIIQTTNRDKKGYVCVIDGNSLSNTINNDDFLNIINNSILNICDGSFIALMASSIYKKNYKSFTGPELFNELLINHKKRSYFLGNEPIILDGLKKNLLMIDKSFKDMIFEPLPFKDVKKFDYKNIGDKINKDNPDLIWISLGAPKQEEFMFHLKPYLKRGVMLGVGAAFNFFSINSNEKRAPSILQRFKLEWLYRTIMNPKKQIPKAILFIKSIPTIYYNEKKVSNETIN